MASFIKRPFNKALIFLHKWLGVTLALLFLVWFISGLVLYFVPFPNLTQAERLAGLQPLQLAKGCCMTLAQVSGSAGLKVSEARLGMHEGNAVWRLLSKPVDDPQAAPLWRTVDAQSGQLLKPLTRQAAMAVAEAFSGRQAINAELLERDQWTVPQGLNPYRPLQRIEMQGSDGLELYVSPGAVEVVRDTRRSERFWNWLGAVPHWIYFTELRRYPDTWHNVVVWLSIPGVILAVTGVVLGTWHLFINRVRWIPYRQWWMRWHHISGLVAAIFTLTWIFSGLLSMNPFGVFSSRSALHSEHMAWRGLQTDMLLKPDQAFDLAGKSNAKTGAKEIDLIQIAGESWYRLRSESTQLLVQADKLSADTVRQTMTELPDELIKSGLLALRSDVIASGLVSLKHMTTYDDMYYVRELTNNSRHTRPLPVWRAQWADGVTLYADATSGKLLLRADKSNRWQRVLYNGLHSFDFEPLLARPLLRDALILIFSLLGTALCVTSCVIAWRVMVPRKRKRNDVPLPDFLK